MAISAELLKRLEAELAGEEQAPVRGSSRRIAPVSTSKATSKPIEPDEIVVNTTKPSPKALVASKSAERVEYNGKVLAIQAVHREGTNQRGEWESDYIEFTGFKSGKFDFSLTLRQAQMLADENVLEAFVAYMAKLPK